MRLVTWAISGTRDRKPNSRWPEPKGLRGPLALGMSDAGLRKGPQDLSPALYHLGVLRVSFTWCSGGSGLSSPWRPPGGISSHGPTSDPAEVSSAPAGVRARPEPPLCVCGSGWAAEGVRCAEGTWWLEER